MLRLSAPLAGIVTIPPRREQQEIASHETSGHHACCDLFDGFDRHGTTLLMVGLSWAWERS
ncbi:MAG: hypothetical protein CL861_03700 [Cyanobium sp. MED843]|nr:hypothetical protein [Cyanobium sp. MED843]